MKQKRNWKSIFRWGEQPHDDWNNNLCVQFAIVFIASVRAIQTTRHSFFLSINKKQKTNKQKNMVFLVWRAMAQN